MTNCFILYCLLYFLYGLEQWCSFMQKAHRCRTAVVLLVTGLGSGGSSCLIWRKCSSSVGRWCNWNTLHGKKLIWVTWTTWIRSPLTPYSSASTSCFGRQVSLLLLRRGRLVLVAEEERKRLHPTCTSLETSHGKPFSIPSMTLGGGRGRGLLATTHCDNGAGMPPATFLHFMSQENLHFTNCIRAHVLMKH